MSLFNECFYTDDFDQEMIDYVDTLGNFTNRAYIGGDSGQFYLKYGQTRDYFWASDVTPSPDFKHLTKQQFKERIGMRQKQFTKADLKDGMVVKYRGGNCYADKNNGLRLVLCKQFIGSDGFAQFREYSKDLLLGNEPTFDIVEVFTVIDAGNGLDYITSWLLKSIWKREEKSAEQLEIEKIQAEMEQLNKRLGELKGKV